MRFREMRERCNLADAGREILSVGERRRRRSESHPAVLGQVRILPVQGWQPPRRSSAQPGTQLPTPRCFLGCSQTSLHPPTH